MDSTDSAPSSTAPNTISRRNFLAASSLMLGAGFLAACSSSASPTVTPSGTGSTSGSPAPASGTITYWYAPSDSDPKTKAGFIKYNVAPFAAKYPGITLQATPKNVDTIDQTIGTALAAGRGPDLVPTPGPSNAIPYAAAGYLADLGPYAERFNWKDKLLPWAALAGEVQGKFVSVPQYYETTVLYYNKTLFEARGWKTPTSRNDLEALAAEMVSAGVIPFSAGNADYQGATEWLVTSFWNAHAGNQNLFDALSGKKPWTDAAFVEPIALLKSYFDKGWFAGGTKNYFTNTDAKKYAQFADGKAAMFISGSWEFQSLPSYFGANGNTNEFDWIPMVPLNTGVPADLFPLSIGGTLSINKSSANPDAAATYLNWLIGDTANMWAQTAALGLPPLPIKFTASDLPTGLDPRLARVYTSLQAATDAGHIGYTTWTFWGGKADTFITSTIDKVLNGDVTPEEFCKGVDAAFQSDLARQLIPTPVAPKA